MFVFKNFNHTSLGISLVCKALWPLEISFNWSPNFGRMRSIGQLWNWAKPDFLPCPMGMDSLNPEEEVSILKNGRSHVSPQISLHYYITFNDKVIQPRRSSLTLVPGVRLRFLKKGKWSELNFRNFWPGFRHLRPNTNTQIHKYAKTNTQ